jgi:hypothetical protein
MVAWTAKVGGGVGGAVRTQRYGPDGAPIGGVQQVETVVGPDYRGVEVAALAGGGYVLTWVRMAASGDVLCSQAGAQSVVARRYGPDGIATGPEQDVNTPVAGLPPLRQIEVAALTGGGFVVTWATDASCGPSARGIFARRFDAQGSPVGLQVQLSDEAFNFAPVVAGLADGGYVTVWRLISSQLLLAQRFGADGSRLGAEDPVDPRQPLAQCGYRTQALCPPYQDSPSVAALDDGGYLIAWRVAHYDVQSDSNPSIAYARLYAADGSASGPPTRISSLASVRGVDVTATARGFVATWDAFGEDIDVFAQTFNSQSLLGP